MNIENLNTNYRTIWSKKDSQTRTPRREFEINEWRRRMNEQLAFDNRIASPTLRSGSEVIEDITRGTTSRTIPLIIATDGTSVMTPEEFEMECKEHMIFA